MNKMWNKIKSVLKNVFYFFMTGSTYSDICTCNDDKLVLRECSCKVVEGITFEQFKSKYLPIPVETNRDRKESTYDDYLQYLTLEEVEDAIKYGKFWLVDSENDKVVAISYFSKDELEQENEIPCMITQLKYNNEISGIKVVLD